MMTNTRTFNASRACVTIIPDDPAFAHGAGITGWTASSGSSPRCAASCRTHHSQILRKEKGGSFRPHCAQFAMYLDGPPQYQIRILNRC
jgi:hypothetical protein